MKVLFDHSLPFSLAHGGYSVLIEQTLAGLRAAGAEVDRLRWWDHEQKADLIHYFAPVQLGYLSQARLSGVPVVLTSLLDWPANQSVWQTRRRRLNYELVNRLPLLGGLRQQIASRAFHQCAHNVVCLGCERDFLAGAYAVNPARVSVVPPGLAESFLAAAPATRDGDYLVCTATIATRKRSVRLAQLARETQTPVLFIGRPYGPDDPYWREFSALVDGRWVRHEANVATDSQLIERLRRARGFVFLSRVESWCFAASEAAACGLPLLLPPVPWARERFGDQARYFPDDPAGEAAALREFAATANVLPAPRIEHLSWLEVGQRLLEVYRSCLP